MPNLCHLICCFEANYCEGTARRLVCVVVIYTVFLTGSVCVFLTFPWWVAHFHWNIQCNLILDKRCLCLLSIETAKTIGTKTLLSLEPCLTLSVCGCNPLVHRGDVFRRILSAKKTHNVSTFSIFNSSLMSACWGRRAKVEVAPPLPPSTWTCAVSHDCVMSDNITFTRVSSHLRGEPTLFNWQWGNSYQPAVVLTVTWISLVHPDAMCHAIHRSALNRMRLKSKQLP